MTASPEKYLFEENFDIAPKENEQRNPYYIKGYNIGFAKGKSDGEKLVRESVDFKLAESMKMVMTALAQLTDQRADYFNSIESETLDLVRLLGTKLSHLATQEDTFKEIIDLITKSLRAARDAPNFDLKIPVGFKDAFIAHLKRINFDQSLEKIDLVEDASLGPSDFKVEWKDGFSMVRGSNFTQKLDALFAPTAGAE